MKREKVYCKVLKADVYKDTKGCLDYTCLTCPELITKQKPKKKPSTQRLNKPSQKERSRMKTVSTIITHTKTKAGYQKITEKDKYIFPNKSQHLPIEGPGRNDLLQLYSWDFDDALKSQEEWEKQNKQGRGPLARWIGAQELKEFYNVYKAGNCQTILEALFVCSLNSLSIPRWCEMAFLKAYRTVRQYKAKSWDDVFGRPHKKGTQLRAKRQEREKGFSVYFRIKRIKEEDPSVPIDENLFERVGHEFGIGKTLTDEYYYTWKNRMKKL